MSAPVLRLATPQDAPAVAAVHLRARADAMPWLPQLHSDEQTRTWVRDVLLVSQRVTVAEDGGAVAAYSATSDGWLEHLYVLPEAQGRGYGRALLERAQDESDGSLRLRVFERNARARAFYAAAGWREVARGTGNEEGLPDLTLAWHR